MLTNKKAVFLDRDGTLNVEKKYLSRPEDLVLFPGVIPALRKLKNAGFLLLIVTNQSGIGRGYYSEADMHRVNQRLLEELTFHGIRIERIYFAPEAPEQESRGRKPSPEFLFDAREEFGIDLGRSYMIGDKLSDLECGGNAGVKRSILVRTGYGGEFEEQARTVKPAPWIVADLTEAAKKILSDDDVK